ncbi:Osmotin, thaumatin-like protein [Daedalea quercina L-15889]|uniref:Osmotin, thaumatin-like protein n=1 Tax=Daedalea quercina L-15889 TaxID=1314783 RepID=A0A165M5B7_9APHY|nr:Osmotin, thaumatin-like protein [Daedalea quercina L-15889]
MIALTTVFLGVLSVVSSATFVTLNNDCGYQVDAAFYPTVEFNETQTGGFALTSAHPSATVLLADNYDGQIWGRTGCDAEGNCATGGCPGGESCTGPSNGGATIANFALNVSNGNDAYSVSDTNGFNIPVTIEPGPGCSSIIARCSHNNLLQVCDIQEYCPTTTAYTVTFC